MPDGKQPKQLQPERALERSPEPRCSLVGAFFSFNLPGIYFSYKKRKFEFHACQAWPQSRSGDGRHQQGRAARPTEKRPGPWARSRPPTRARSAKQQNCGGRSRKTLRATTCAEGEKPLRPVPKPLSPRRDNAGQCEEHTTPAATWDPAEVPAPYGQVRGRRRPARPGPVLPQLPAFIQNSI